MPSGPLGCSAEIRLSLCGRQCVAIIQRTCVSNHLYCYITVKLLRRSADSLQNISSWQALCRTLPAHEHDGSHIKTTKKQANSAPVSSTTLPAHEGEVQIVRRKRDGPAGLLGVGVSAALCCPRTSTAHLEDPLPPVALTFTLTQRPLGLTMLGDLDVVAEEAESEEADTLGCS